MFTRSELNAAMQHYQTHGWVLIDALDELTKSRLPTFAEEIAALGNTNGVIRHDELTAAGPAIARAEHFVPTHAGATGVITQLEPIATLLLQEPAVLYKEKINFKQPGGAGFRAHQDARAYPHVRTHLSAMVAIDEANLDNGCLEVVSGHHDELLEVDEHGVIVDQIATALPWMAAPVPQGATLWFHSWIPHRSGANHSTSPRRALFPTFHAAAEGNLRAAYYEHKLAYLNQATNTANVVLSLTGDFEGIPVP